MWGHVCIILDACIVFGKVFLYSSGEAYFSKDIGIGVHSCTCVARYFQFHFGCMLGSLQGSAKNGAAHEHAVNSS